MHDNVRGCWRASGPFRREMARRYRDKVVGELPLEMEAVAPLPEANLNAAV